MSELTTYSISLPVHIADEHDKNICQGLANVSGTCFPIGGSYMLTAGHVVAALQDAEQISIGCGAVGIFNPSTFVQIGLRVTDKEILPGDIGLLKVSFMQAEQEEWIFPLHWTRDSIGLGCSVRTPGYGFADHVVDGERFLVQRSFQGSIVSNIDKYLPLGMKGKSFGVYETSFCVPRGHSGAPLLRDDGRIIGIVIGNSQSKMLVHSSRRSRDHDCS